MNKKKFLTMNVRDYEKFLQFFLPSNAYYVKLWEIFQSIFAQQNTPLCIWKKGEIKCTTRPLNLIILYILATRSDIFLGQGEKRPKIINHKHTKLTFMTTFLLSTIIPMLFFPEDNKKNIFYSEKKIILTWRYHITFEKTLSLWLVHLSR